MIETLEKDFFFAQEKIRAVQNSIDRLKMDNDHLYSENCEYDRMVKKLQFERTELIDKLEHLTRKYDECVRDISIDRSEMEAHNKRHAKLVTAKLLFNNLVVMVRRRQHVAL